MGEERYFVLDVESIGLHGEGFAVGIVVIGVSGTIYEEHRFACPPIAARGDETGRAWVAQHVPSLIQTATNPKHVRDQFWAIWERWRRLKVPMVADCAWPVEARFLLDCVTDDIRRHWNGPYPLLELASFLVAVGRDPLMERPRLENEPLHDPLGDARQSARILVECLKELQARAEAIDPDRRGVSYSREFQRDDH
jgi:hypothetical protein